MHLLNDIVLAEERVARLHEEAARDRLVALARAARRSHAADGARARSTWRTGRHVRWTALRHLVARLAIG